MVCASVGRANHNKLSLVGMQLPEKYKEKFDVSSEGHRLTCFETSNFSLYFSGSCIPTSESLLRGNFFQCHVFAMKSVQNLKSFWRSSQNYFVLALFSSL